MDLKPVIGFSTPGTMKVKGKVADREVVVLIDCGATHNFILPQLVDELKLVKTNTSNYGIVMGIGLAVKQKSVCKSMLVAPLSCPSKRIFCRWNWGEGGVNVILEIQWLRTMGFMGIDRKDLTMTSIWAIRR